jgi:helix-turn-helix protein
MKTNCFVLFESYLEDISLKEWKMQHHLSEEEKQAIWLELVNGADRHTG